MEVSKIAELNHAVMAPFLKRLISRRETQGVCILGSHARTGERPFADLQSDFDIALFIDLPILPAHLKMPPLEFQRAIQPLCPAWLPNFKFRLPPTADAVQRLFPLQINVHQLVLNYEESSDFTWPDDRREAFQTTCEIYYDPSGRVERLIEKKRRFAPEEYLQRLRLNLALIPVLLEHSAFKCAARDLLFDSLLSITEAVERIIQLLYDLNFQPLPHRKWRFSHLARLSKLPSGAIHLLQEVMLPSGLSSNELAEKAASLRSLCAGIANLAMIEGLLVDDPYQEFITARAPGWQLKYATFGDATFGHTLHQYEKMNLAEWNDANFNLLPES